MSDSPNLSLPDRIQVVIDRIDQAISQIESGEMINLDDLDNDVAAICEEAHEPAPEETEQVDAKMDLMIEKLEELSQALDEFEHTDEDDEEE